MASVVAAHRLQSIGLVIVAQGLSCSDACGIFPDQGLNPCPLHYQANSYLLYHQGSPVLYIVVSHTLYIHFSLPKWCLNKQKFLILMQFSLSIFSLVNSTFYSLFKKYLSILRSYWYSVLLSRNLILPFTFRTIVDLDRFFFFLTHSIRRVHDSIIFFQTNVHLTNIVYQEILFSVRCSATFILKQVVVLHMGYF